MSEEKRTTLDYEDVEELTSRAEVYLAEIKGLARAIELIAEECIEPSVFCVLADIIHEKADFAYDMLEDI